MIQRDDFPGQEKNGIDWPPENTDRLRHGIYKQEIRIETRAGRRPVDELADLVGSNAALVDFTTSYPGFYTSFED